MSVYRTNPLTATHGAKRIIHTFEKGNQFYSLKSQFVVKFAHNVKLYNKYMTIVGERVCPVR